MGKVVAVTAQPRQEPLTAMSGTDCRHVLDCIGNSSPIRQLRAAFFSMKGGLHAGPADVSMCSLSGNGVGLAASGTGILSALHVGPLARALVSALALCSATR